MKLCGVRFVNVFTILKSVSNKATVNMIVTSCHTPVSEGTLKRFTCAWIMRTSTNQTEISRLSRTKLHYRQQPHRLLNWFLDYSCKANLLVICHKHLILLQRQGEATRRKPLLLEGFSKPASRISRFVPSGTNPQVITGVRAAASEAIHNLILKTVIKIMS